MNILEICFHGDGRLDEPKLNWVLGFQLDRRRTHGNGRTFLAEFLEQVGTTGRAYRCGGRDSHLAAGASTHADWH